ncbi:MAG: 50S ribosomal protein L1 [Firmicutes bacterium]|uniref:Large ribosomal subunit protein uL1 n=1 Tax=Candidatus Scatoplasma merdavium TaxID=2840932 RepID=A0A9D9GLH0_9BACL|nr:50S ribosomal protein L1 [Candidatus Scatoplasma merdavium]
MKRGKKYTAALKLVEKGRKYTLAEACELVKSTAVTKFDSTIDISFHLNLDTKQPDQQLRGTITLPYGNGKTKKVLAITAAKVEEAKAAGADYAGGAELLEKIQKENWFDFDVIVATPDMMGQLGKMGRILGPKGLMPNPKSGTVSPDIATAVKEIKNGKLAYRVDKDGNLHLSIARVSFDNEKIQTNLQTVIDTINRIKPSAVKGTYILSATLHTTMGPAIRLAI